MPGKEISHVDPLDSRVVGKTADHGVKVLPASVIPHELERVSPEVEVAIDRLFRWYADRRSEIDPSRLEIDQ